MLGRAGLSIGVLVEPLIGRPAGAKVAACEKTKHRRGTGGTDALGRTQCCGHGPIISERAGVAGTAVCDAGAWTYALIPQDEPTIGPRRPVRCVAAVQASALGARVHVRPERLVEC